MYLNGRTLNKEGSGILPLSPVPSYKAVKVGGRVRRRPLIASRLWSRRCHSLGEDYNSVVGEGHKTKTLGGQPTVPGPLRTSFSLATMSTRRSQGRGRCPFSLLDLFLSATMPAISGCGPGSSSGTPAFSWGVVYPRALAACRTITEASTAAVAVVPALKSALVTSSVIPLCSGTRSFMNRSANRRLSPKPIPAARRVSKRCWFCASISISFFFCGPTPSATFIP